MLYFWSVLLYAVESWTLKAVLFNISKILGMLIHQRMLRVSWTDLLTNEEVLQRARRERQLLTTIKYPKSAYLGHVFSGEKYFAAFSNFQHSQKKETSDSDQEFRKMVSF